jgi:hypothetical protein
MPTQVSVFARVRGALRDIYGTGEQQPVAADGAELITVLGMPELTEIVRQGNSWQAQFTTGVAALTAIPTTTSLMSINNAETGGGKSYVIDSFGTYEGVADATQTDVTMLMAMNNKKGSAQASAGTLFTTSQSLSGKGAYGGAAIFRSAATVVNDGWYPHQTLGAMAAAAAGANFKVNEVFVRGLYIVPPGGSFSFAAVKAAAAAALQQFPFIRWHEVQLTLG